MKDFKRDEQGRIQPTYVVTEKDMKEAMERPSDFGWYGGKDMFRTWSLGPIIEHRDSGVLDRSNAAALKKFLASDKSLKDEWNVVRCSHWAVGHVYHLSFHAVEEQDGKQVPTRIFAIIQEWFNYLANNYPVADEELFSEMEYEDTLKGITSAIEFYAYQHKDFDLAKLPLDYASQAYHWFSENAEEAIEPRDDHGGYPEDKHIAALLKAIKWEKGSAHAEA